MITNENELQRGKTQMNANQFLGRTGLLFLLLKEKKHHNDDEQKPGEEEI